MSQVKTVHPNSKREQISDSDIPIEAEEDEDEEDDSLEKLMNKEETNVGRILSKLTT